MAIFWAMLCILILGAWVTVFCCIRLASQNNREQNDREQYEFLRDWLTAHEKRP